MIVASVISKKHCTHIAACFSELDSNQRVHRLLWVGRTRTCK